MRPLPSSQPESEFSGALRLRVYNERAALEAARAAMLGYIGGMGLSEDTVFRLELILEETLMNLILHAYPDGGRHAIDIRMALEDDRIVMCFEDDGVPFDPDDAPQRAAPRSLAEAVPGGLGLLLTRKSARRVQHERANERNRLTIEVDRTAT